ncbi:MAG: SDR family NAD(P)-dependent oxidoreductase [Hamadaea sp.]|nr:SDR family NAD(P)-dependent oxidoreductase [Hamadaea sp.]
MADLIVVTGAQGALGRAVVAEFLERGAEVVALDRALPQKTPAGVHALQVDLTDRRAVHDAWTRIDEIGRAQALVNVAGGYFPGAIAEVTEEDLAAAMEINVSTALWSCQAAATRLAKDGGAIVNVGSRSAVTGLDPVAYSLSKGAVVRLTGLLADQFKSSRVRVNAVMPALMDTPANRAAIPESVMATKAVPVEAVAKVIAFLCGEDAAPITGAVIPVYGFA